MHIAHTRRRIGAENKTSSQWRGFHLSVRGAS